MDRQVIRACALAVTLTAAANAAAAHQLVVFASANCDMVTVEAKFSNGNPAQLGDVRVLDAENALLKTLALEEDGTVDLPLADLDHGDGLVIEVDTGSHQNYWILTPDDIAHTCES